MKVYALRGWGQLPGERYKGVEIRGRQEGDRNRWEDCRKKKRKALKAGHFKTIMLSPCVGWLVFLVVTAMISSDNCKYCLRDLSHS